MIDLIIIAPFLVLAFILAIGVGANDETFAPVVGAHRLTPLQSVLIGSVFAVVGALTLGNNVAGTVGTGITSLDLSVETNGNMVFAVLFAMAIVLILSSGFGLPISSTHAMVGAITGLAIFEASTQSIPLLDLVNQSKIVSIIVSWFLSPAIGLAGSFIIYKMVDYITIKYTKGLDDVSRNEKIAANLLLLFVLITALSRGGNDVANAVSPLISTFSNPAVNQAYIPLLLGGIGMGVGLILLARRVLKTLGNEIVELTASKALAVQISTALITFTGANLGIPLSGTHILVASFIGVALSSRSRVNIHVIGKISVSAISTPVIGGFLSVIIFVGLSSFGINL